MIGAWRRADRRERRAATLAAIIAAQALCAMFFIGDVIVDYAETGHLDEVHMAVEAFAALALSGGVAFQMVELRRLLARMDSMETGLRAARGEMAQLVEGFFDRWGLTAAEREVAMLLLKGFDNESVAEIRGTAKGTVRAQTAAIYAKAGVDGRAQLISLFLEELLADPQPQSRPAPGVR